MVQVQPIVFTTASQLDKLDNSPQAEVQETKLGILVSEIPLFTVIVMVLYESKNSEEENALF